METTIVGICRVWGLADEPESARERERERERERDREREREREGLGFRVFIADYSQGGPPSLIKSAD